jgi:hypothetical protein
MVKAKVDTKDFTTCPIDKWNGTTFREYIKHLNIEKNGVPSITNNVMVENSMIKNFTKEYGNVVAKQFVEECVKNHKGNDRYPTVNFSFMVRFMKESVLPRVLNNKVKQTKLQEIRQKLQEEQADVASYF